MKTLIIKHDGSTWDVIDEAGRCCNGLTWGELIEQVIRLTITAPGNRAPDKGFLMMTAAQWRAMEQERVLRMEENLKNLNKEQP